MLSLFLLLFFRNMQLSPIEIIKSSRTKIIAFRDKIRGLKRWQKILLIIVAVCLPAGVLLSSLLFVKFNQKK